MNREEQSRSLRERAHAVIPGGTHTYAKGDDQYPDEAPAVLMRGEGCRVWDAAGNEFIEYGMGLRAVSLGHAHPRVTEAAVRQMRVGVNYTRPAPIEIECAELLAELVGADMVKFCKDGSTATTAAVKLARAHTGRDYVALCEDHPFFSYDDWFIGTTPMNAGIPRAISELSLTFRYNDLASLEALFDSHPGSVACVILEPERTDPPQDGFLTGVQALCAEHGAVFILDEMITGFRWHLGGAQAYYGLSPDLSIFGKAMANGFSLSALVGRREIMERGGIRHDGERVFLLSTTHGAETHALAAAVETMTIYRDENIVDKLWAAGTRLSDGINRVASELGVSEHFLAVGKPPSLVYATRDRSGRPSQAYRTLFLQEMIDRGFIVPSFVVSAAHEDQDIDRTIEAVRSALVVYAAALEQGSERFLRGPSVKPVFRRFN
jgi:glutamate-1-semialdehyde 2,1-aminomutase